MSRFHDYEPLEGSDKCKVCGLGKKSVRHLVNSVRAQMESDEWSDPALAPRDKSLEERCFESAQMMIRVDSNARNEQREKAAKIAEEFGPCDIRQVRRLIAQAIREGK